MKTCKFTFWTLFIVLVTAGIASAQTQDSFNRQKLTRYLNKLAHHHKIMASVAIDSAGELVYHHSTGFRGIKDGDTLKANGQTVYRIGSISKTFTAVMIFQLIQEGKLSLSTKLAKFYSKIPNAGSITIKNMLHQRSGLYNFTDSSYIHYRFHKQTEQQMLHRFRQNPSQFPPGSKTQYSNTNYVLLGYIIEDITGDSYAHQLKKRISEPLNLQHTRYGGPVNAANNEAESFRYTGGKWIKVPEVNMSIPGGAGGVVSTPSDMARFITALFNGKLVSKKSLNHMTNIEHTIGMGLMTFPFYDMTAYGHEGGIDGFVSYLVYFPKKDVAVAATINGLSYSPRKFMTGIFDIYFGKGFKIPSFKLKHIISLSPNEMQKYVGTYTSERLPINFKVFVENDTLKARAQAPGQNAFPLTATSKMTLHFKPGGIVMKFDSLKNGKFQQFIIKQHGYSFKFKRK